MELKSEIPKYIQKIWADFFSFNICIIKECVSQTWSCLDRHSHGEHCMEEFYVSV